MYSGELYPGAPTTCDAIASCLFDLSTTLASPKSATYQDSHRQLGQRQIRHPWQLVLCSILVPQSMNVESFVQPPDDSINGIISGSTGYEYVCSEPLVK